MTAEVPFRIKKGKIPVFSNKYPPVFLKHIQMPDLETFKKIYRRRIRVEEEKLDIYWEAMNARFDGKTLREAGIIVSRSADRVRQIEQSFLSGLIWYEQYVERL